MILAGPSDKSEPAVNQWETIIIINIIMIQQKQQQQGMHNNNYSV